MKRYLLALALVSMIMPRAYAGAIAPTPYDAYDGIAPGGRQTAMGQAFTAGVADPANVYFNPAGLAANTSNILSATYEPTRQSNLSTNDVFASEAIRNRNFLFVCLTGPKFAISWRPLANTTISTSTAASDWESDDIKVNAFTISTSHQHSTAVRSGLNLTYLTGQVAHSSLIGGIPTLKLSDGYGVALDYGLQMVLTDQFSIGVNLKNIAGTMWWESYEKEQLPFTSRFGAAYTISSVMTLTADWETRYYLKGDKVDITHYGLEQAIGSVLRLRAGMWGEDLNDQEKVHFSAGLGYLSSACDLSIAGEKYRVSTEDVVRYVLSLSISL